MHVCSLGYIKTVGALAIQIYHGHVHRSSNPDGISLPAENVLSSKDLHHLWFKASVVNSRHLWFKNVWVAKASVVNFRHMWFKIYRLLKTIQ
jgi:hypothetical protein